MCEHTHAGADCSLRNCPNGTAWADFSTAVDTAHAMAECSNMGTCDRATGVCKCRAGFMGSACEFTRCPGGIESGKDCNGHGVCISMREAAEHDNGHALLRTTTYSLWDQHKILGCACDDGWTEFDCSLRTCPFGDDPQEVSDSSNILFFFLFLKFFDRLLNGMAFAVLCFLSLSSSLPLSLSDCSLLFV